MIVLLLPPVCHAATVGERHNKSIENREVYAFHNTVQSIERNNEPESVISFYEGSEVSRVF